MPSRQLRVQSQRTFVVEVMGRQCGYLALMASLASAANWLIIPEQPPAEDWVQHMCRDIEEGRGIGRRQSVAIVAEGAQDRSGNPITADQIRTVLENELGEDTRITILGHVQRGGAPSAFDRYLADAARACRRRTTTHRRARRTRPTDRAGWQPGDQYAANGLRGTDPGGRRAHQGQEDFEGAMVLRGGSFRESYEILRTIQQAAPRPTPAGRRRSRFAVVHGGGPAPGMNNAVRAAVRLGLDRGYTVLAVKNGFRGLHDGDIQEMGWMDVSGWVSDGGAEIGTNRYVPSGAAIAQIAKQVAAQRSAGAMIFAGMDDLERLNMMWLNGFRRAPPWAGRLQEQIYAAAGCDGAHVGKTSSPTTTAAVN